MSNNFATFWQETDTQTVDEVNILQGQDNLEIGSQ